MASPNVENLLLARLAKHMMERVFDDWASMIGARVTIASHAAAQHPSAHMLAPVLRGDCAVVQTRVEGDCEGVLTFVFPSDLVIELVGEMILLPAPVRARKRAAGLDDEDLEPFRELSNLLCGACNHAFQRLRRHLRVSQSVEHLRVSRSPRGDVALLERLPEGALATVRLVVELQGRRYPVFQTWPHALALAVADLFLRRRAG